MTATERSDAGAGTDGLPRQCAVQRKPRSGRRLVVWFALSGALAISAAVGAALGYRRAGVECVLLDSPVALRAGSPVTLRFLLRNSTGQTVKLRPRFSPCWHAQLEGVPAELLPYEAKEIGLRLSTAGLNGPKSIGALISTNGEPRVVIVTADVTINADWVVRHFSLGAVPANSRVDRRIRIDDVPAERLVRVGIPSKPYWSVRCLSAVGRSIEIGLAATLPGLDSGASERRDVCDFSLYFSNADVRRVQVLATVFVCARADDVGPSIHD